jgi:hypothetical protein
MGDKKKKGWQNSVQSKILRNDARWPFQEHQPCFSVTKFAAKLFLANEQMVNFSKYRLYNVQIATAMPAFARVLFDLFLAVGTIDHSANFWSNGAEQLIYCTFHWPRSFSIGRLSPPALRLTVGTSA